MSKAQEPKPELLPCPMCGGTEILVKKRKTTMVECKACGLVVFNYQDGIERDAIAHWNRRAASSEQQAAQQDERDAALGRVAMGFVDRAGDVHPGIDDAEAICAEFHNAMLVELAQWLPPEMIRAARASNGGKAND